MTNGGVELPRKIYILSSKTENMRRVFENLTYGANARRPEQRGILGVSEDDLVLLYDSGTRTLMGPFTARRGVYYTEVELWSKKDWKFIVPLDPLMGKIGYVKGKKLLDLIVEAGKLSLRDRYTIDSYWVNTLLASEAESVLEKFYELAEFKNLSLIAKEIYGIKKVRQLEIPGRSIEEVLCEEIRKSKSRRLGEWIYEAALVTKSTIAKRIVGDHNAVRAAGVFLYSRRYLDVVYLTDDRFNAVIEVKEGIDRNSLEGAVDQASYYTYSISKGLGLPRDRLLTVVVYGRSTVSDSEVARSFEKLAVEKAREYGLRDDLFVASRLDLHCVDGKLVAEIKIIS
ncbi:MAG: hypothetical protein F7C37_04220 [Desulfurococcales archaeon]|nr:hypothetical protein [Desulfurococcales archaeon]